MVEGRKENGSVPSTPSRFLRLTRYNIEPLRVLYEPLLF